MRENFGIFKGKRIDTGVWVQGNYLHLTGGPVDPDMHFIVTADGQYNKVHPESVGEFTGVRDRNGRMLFENDVISNIYVLLSIEYFESAATFLATEFEGKNRYILDGEKLRDFFYYGNMFEQPFDIKNEQLNLSLFDM